MDPYQTQNTYEVEAATRLSRLGAVFVDGRVGFAPVGAILLMLPMLMLRGGTSALLILVGIAVLVAIAVLITQIVLVARHGQTIGKRVVGIRMITSAGDIPNVWRVFFLRWLPFVVAAGVVEYVFKVRGLGNLVHVIDALLIFQPNRRCLHDLLADTHVIKSA
jgi:uncharacterized RDD family membrane protein YckC